MQRVSGDETAAGGLYGGRRWGRQAVKGRRADGRALENFINSIKLNIFWNPETEFPRKIETLENILMSPGWYTLFRKTRPSFSEHDSLWGGDADTLRGRERAGRDSAAGQLPLTPTHWRRLRWGEGTGDMYVSGAQNIEFASRKDW